MNIPARITELIAQRDKYDAEAGAQLTRFNQDIERLVAQRDAFLIDARRQIALFDGQIIALQAVQGDSTEQPKLMDG